MIERIKYAYRFAKPKRFYALAYEDFETRNLIYALYGVHWILKRWYYRKNKFYKDHWFLRSLVKYIDKNFAVHPVDGNSAISYSGEEFIEFTSCGEFNGKLKRRYKTKIGSVWALEKRMKKYLTEANAENRKYFQWRLRPELHSKFLSNTCYTRFICSDKPFKEGE